MMPAIELIDVTKRFGSKEALKGLSFQVAQGSIFGFLGPNGAGKTTTMSILTGILRPSSGIALVLGQEMAPAREALRKRIGTVHDSENMFEQLTAAEHIEFSARLYGLRGSEIRRRREELLGLLGLNDDADRPIQTYSHGMKKKTALACALVHDPEILFLDEPFEGMDAASILSVMHNIKLLRARGVTVFLTSHILDLVERICDEVAIVVDGRSVYQELLAAGSEALANGNRTLEKTFLRLTSAQTPSTLSWAMSGASPREKR